ncbi:MAG: peptide-modifying radical SAM enzyme CbpB [Magnetococcales bacterium]|nr:peptide-modifying radical SAM enzyme CbpB [Magnetococcales bacterium]MBF0156786.1 peptide-modifying radical SAM enzyme CbpB [Magnetococcales bacterium]
MAVTHASRDAGNRPSGSHLNTGEGPTLLPLDIGHPAYMGLVDPDTAFWALVHKDRLADALEGGELLTSFHQKRASFQEEMQTLRFGLQPSAVYFNPTDRCNLDCSYCYIPQTMRRHGTEMSREKLLEALRLLQGHFAKTLPPSRRPRVIFHGAEPLLNKEALFAGIAAYNNEFDFGVQTNATLLDGEAVDFLTSRGVSIGLSLDGIRAETTHRTRKSWAGNLNVHAKVLEAMERLAGYPYYSVIVTVTRENASELPQMVEFLHERQVPNCLLNMTRCTLPAAREVRLADEEAATPFIAALERSHELFRQSGRKLVVANFANILLAILAPTARRLMCDISPCGGGRAFFALAANGDLFPCSEFIGLDSFRGGNLFAGGLDAALTSPAFHRVTGRTVETIDPCRRCAIRHFCGSPCPAEAHEMNGGMDRPGAFCAFYEEQTRYAFRLIADGIADDFLWDGWDDGVVTLFDKVGPLVTPEVSPP